MSDSDEDYEPMAPVPPRPNRPSQQEPEVTFDDEYEVPVVRFPKPPPKNVEDNAYGPAITVNKNTSHGHTESYTEVIDDEEYEIPVQIRPAKGRTSADKPKRLSSAEERVINDPLPAPPPAIPSRRGSRLPDPNAPPVPARSFRRSSAPDTRMHRADTLRSAKAAPPLPSRGSPDLVRSATLMPARSAASRLRSSRPSPKRMTVRLEKIDGTLGVTLRPLKDSGTLIFNVKPKSSEHRRLTPGMWLYSINGEDLTYATMPEINAVVKKSKYCEMIVSSEPDFKALKKAEAQATAAPTSISSPTKVYIPVDGDRPSQDERLKLLQKVHSNGTIRKKPEPLDLTNMSPSPAALGTPASGSPRTPRTADEAVRYKIPWQMAEKRTTPSSSRSPTRTNNDDALVVPDDDDFVIPDSEDEANGDEDEDDEEGDDYMEMDEMLEAKNSPSRGRADSNASNRDITNALNLSDAEFGAYNTIWNNATGNGTKLAANAAVTLLAKSALSRADLKDIWNKCLIAKPSDGSLSRHEFFRACKLVALRQTGKPADVRSLPTKLNKVASFKGELGESSSSTTVASFSTTEVREYTKFWARISGGKELVSANNIAGALSRAGLQKDDLKTIWDLSKTAETQRGHMGKNEFFTACKYVAVRQSGKELAAQNLTVPTSPAKFQ
eukprot:m.25879 g.25879  ORF g.25879 m.25879 type:complete len:667 (-) comp7746_c0_seq1:24-2024(-)